MYLPPNTKTRKWRLVHDDEFASQTTLRDDFTIYRNCHWDTPRDPYCVRGWADGGRYNWFQGCTFEGAMGKAIVAPYVRLDGCVILDIGADGVFPEMPGFVEMNDCTVTQLGQLGPGAHSDALQIMGGEYYRIRRCKFIVPHTDANPVSSCAHIIPQYAPIHDLLITGCEFDGGNISLRLYRDKKTGQAPTNVRIFDNKFLRHTFQPIFAEAYSERLHAHNDLSEASKVA